MLEGAYSDLRRQEEALDFDFARPLDCVETLPRFTFRYFERIPYFESLLRAENMMRGKFVAKSTIVLEEAAHKRAVLRRIRQAGEAMGEIRPGIDPVQLYVTITALSRFHLGKARSLKSAARY